MNRRDGVWFPAKTDCRWLWDLPTCWQGWTVVVCWWIALIAGVLYLSTIVGSLKGVVLFVAVMSLLLTAICYAKGERLRLRD